MVQDRLDAKIRHVFSSRSFGVLEVQSLKSFLYLFMPQVVLDFQWHISSWSRVVGRVGSSVEVEPLNHAFLD